MLYYVIHTLMMTYPYGLCFQHFCGSSMHASIWGVTWLLRQHTTLCHSQISGYCPLVPQNWLKVQYPMRFVYIMIMSITPLLTGVIYSFFFRCQWFCNWSCNTSVLHQQQTIILEGFFFFLPCEAACIRIILATLNVLFHLDLCRKTYYRSS